MGGKFRLAKHILPIILHNKKPDTCYIEPFVGGGNTISEVKSSLRLGSDINPYAIAALKLIRDNVTSLPKSNLEVSESDYKQMRSDTTVDAGLRGYYGFALSYGGKFFGGLCRASSNPKRDYVAEAYRAALKQSPKLKGVILGCVDYTKLCMPPNSIIYCDPPYKNTTGYSGVFNYAAFWDKCRTWANDGHKVFISEYNAPPDFKCIWQKEMVSILRRSTGSKKTVEKLFVLGL